MTIALRTRDVLERARAFHAQLARFYEQHQATAGSEKLKMLLAYMQRHETNLAENLSRYSREAAQRILDTWFSYVPDEAVCASFDKITLPPNASVQEVVKIALRLDECLVRFYAEMAERAVSQEVRELFQTLLRNEKKEETRMVRDALAMDQEF